MRPVKVAEAEMDDADRQMLGRERRPPDFRREMSERGEPKARQRFSHGVLPVSFRRVAAGEDRSPAVSMVRFALCGLARREGRLGDVQEFTRAEPSA